MFWKNWKSSKISLNSTITVDDSAQESLRAYLDRLEDRKESDEESFSNEETPWWAKPWSDLSQLLFFSQFNVSGGQKKAGDSVQEPPTVSSGFQTLMMSNAAPTASDDGAGGVLEALSFATLSSASLSFLTGPVGFRIDGLAAGDRLARGVSEAGDVNGDGFDDLIVGSAYADPNGESSGSSYVVFGKAGGFDDALDLSTLNGANGFRLDGGAAGDQAGFDVAGGGDINGDGFDDVIVGAWLADSNGSGSGATYIVFGKAGGFSATLDLSTLNGTNGFRLDGAAIGDVLGVSVANAGDINGDGFDDVFAGARFADPNGNGSAGSSYVVFGKAGGFSASLDVGTLNGTNGFQLDGLASDDQLGRVVSAAGDVNGDGFEDLIVGAMYADVNAVDSGAAYVVFGKASGFSANLDLNTLNGSNGFRLEGVAFGDQAGAWVSGAGDVNGDGFADVIVGARLADNGGASTGSSYVVFGKAGGFSPSINLNTLDGTNGFRLDGAAADDRAFVVSDVGDFNGDGFDDVIVGSYLADPNGSNSGSTYVVFGKVGGFSASLNLGTLSGTDGFRLNGVAPGDIAGLDVSGAGDINGDGFDDLVVSARDADPNGANSGSTYVLYGSEHGLTPNVPSLSLNSLNGANGFRLEGAAVGDEAGMWVSNAGDMNGDGFADIIIGARKADPNGSESGASYVVFGKASGFSASTNLNTLNGTNGFRLEGALPYDRAFIASDAGDVNGDGFDDVIIGAYVADPNGQQSGTSYVVFGKAGGFSASLNLGTLNGTNGFRLEGSATGDLAGYDVSGAGDVNNDGFDDLIVSVRDADPGGLSEAGATYVVYGKAGGFNPVVAMHTIGGANGFRMDGVAAGDRLSRGVSDAGDINGDGIADLIIGAAYADTVGVDSGSSYVVFGNASGFGSTLDLTTLNGANGFRLDGVAAGDKAGFDVAGGGDINGDGFDDLIVGAWNADANGPNSGSSYVVFGKASGFGATLDLGTLDGTNGFRLDGGAAGDNFGVSVANAGDVNGDGFDDVIVGAWHASPHSNIRAGANYVVFGKASGFDASLDVSTLSGTNGFRLVGLAEEDRSGRVVSGAGDVNGDGFDDLIVGAMHADVNGANSGAAYVILSSNYVANEDATALIGNVLANDSDPDGDTLTVTAVDAVSAQGAAVAIASNGTFTYNPAGAATLQALSAGQTIQDTFTYTVSDGNGGTDTAIVTVTVTGVNDPVVATDDVGITDEDTVLNVVAASGVLANDADVDTGDTISVTAMNGSGAAIGMPTALASGALLTLSADGSYVYNPNGQFEDLAVGQSTTDSFTYTVTSTDGTTDTATVTLTINGVNDASVAVADMGSTDEDTVLNVVAASGVLANDTDVDAGDTISVTAMNGSGAAVGVPTALASGALLTLSADGSYVYDPNGQFEDLAVGQSTTDSFTYTITSTDGTTDTATVTLTINGVNDAPIANTDNAGPTAFSLSALDGTNGFRMDGVTLDDFSGRTVSNVGDVNGDGYDDVIIGAPGADPNGSGSGSSYVVFGKADGFTASIDLSSLNGATGFRLDGVAAEDGSGFAVSAAGDVNGDGYDDVIIGASGADPNGAASGSSYVLFGKASGFSSTMNLNTLDGTNGFRLDGVNAGDVSGYSVSEAGDVNGDGYDDVIIGAYHADPNGAESGSSYVVFGKASGFTSTIDLSTLNGTTGFRLDGVAADDNSGRSVSNAGDVNGDGYDDIAIGAFHSDVNGMDSGAGYIVFGKASGFASTMNLGTLDGTNGFRLEGVAVGDGAGVSISSAGDVNGDGFEDVILGAHVADSNGANSGSSYVIFGKASGFAATINLNTLDGTNGFRLDGSFSEDRAGASVSSAGDFNGDGFDDLIVGAYKADLNGVESGSTYIVFGKQGGFSATIDLATLDATEGFRLDGAEANDRAGQTVSAAGDLNGDGFDDVIIGAALADPNGANSGSSYVVFGRAGELTTIQSTRSLDGGNGFRLDGVSGDDNSGRSVSSAGDVNGDGFDDVIVGAFHSDVNGVDSGSAYVVFGKAGGFSSPFNLSTLDGSNGYRLEGVAAGDAAGVSVSDAGDVNGDGFDDVIVSAFIADPNGVSSGSSYVVFGKAAGFSASLNLSALNGTNGFRLDGAAAGDKSGISVSSAGDVNGDGFDDVIVGAYRASPNGGSSGSSYVVFGKASGFSSTLNLNSLNGTDGFRLDGASANDRSGRSVSSAGDVNGDGYDDVIVGVALADPNGSASGSSYVVFGKASGFSSTLNLNSLNGTDGFRLDGAAADDISGISVSSAGDINGDGFDDVIIGASGADPNGLGSGSSYVVFGKASGFTSTMDLSTLSGANGFRLDGVAAGDGSGFSVSNAGDVNGDGVDDLLIGANGADPDGILSAGSSYVVFGRTSGFSSTLDLGTLDGVNGFRIDGEQSDHVSGYSVSAAGDVNGDGFDDVLVGAYRADPNGTNSGSSYVLFGSNYVTDEDSSALIGNVLFNDTDADGDTLTVTAVDALSAQGATVAIASNGTFTYNPTGAVALQALAVGQSLVDTFTYTVSDGNGGTDTATVAVTVLGENDPAVAADDVGSTDEDTVLNVVAASGVLANDTDVDNGETVSVTAMNGSGAAVGVPTILASGALLTLSADGSYVYNPNGQFESLAVGESTTDSFTYTITSIDGTTDTATVTLTINGVNDTPIANSDSAGPSVVQLSALNGTIGFRLDGVAAGDLAGGVSDAGDVNGDGFADVIIGARYTDHGGNNAGSAYVVFGKAGGFDASANLSILDGTNGFRLDGAAGGTPGDSIGVRWSISGAGDVNGDGFDDVIVGAFGADINGANSGAAYVVFGKASGFSPTLSVSALDGTSGFRLEGTAVEDRAGLSVSSAGDINGDGFDDVIVGAYRADPNGSQSGANYVVFGKAGGFTSTLDLGTLNGTNGFRLEGVAAGDRSGRSVSDAGDINGDGFDDLIIGSGYTDTNGADSGTAYVLFGKAGGFATTTNLSTLNGTNGFRLDGVAGGDFAGISVSGAGDVNNDGFDDVIVGANGVDVNGSQSGAAYVVFGKAGGFSAATNLSTLDGTNGFRLEGVTSDYFTGGTVSNAGDVNGDGFDDVIISAVLADVNGTNSGASYVVFGKAGGFASSINLNSLSGANGFSLEGVVAGDEGGWASAAGDVNGDGFDDLIVGAYRADPNGTDSGSSYVIFGSNYVTDEDSSALIGNVLFNDTDADGDTLTVTVVDALSAQGATVAIASNGTFTYNPTGAAALQALAVGQSLVDTFTYTVSDGNGGTDTATVTLTVTGVNDPAVATDDVGSTDEDTALNVVAVSGVLANDTDLDAGHTVSVTAMNGSGAAIGVPTALASGALLTLNADGSYVYNPNGQFESLAGGASTTDSFTYTITSTDGTTDTATVTLTINGVNDAPVGVADAGSTDEDTVLNVVAASGVLSNDTDVDAGATLTVTAMNGSGAAIGVPTALASGALLTLNADGSYVYNPNGQFEGLAAGASTTDSFTYTVSDGNGGTDTATVTLTINGVNDAPVGVADAGSTDEDTVLNVVAAAGVLTNDTDVDTGATLTVTEMNGSGAAIGVPTALASGALLTLNTDGSYAYNPNGQFESLAAGASTTDSFTYTVSDGNGGTDTATATITINGVNDAPTVAVGLTSQVGEDGQAFSYTVPGGTFADVDASDSLTLTATKSDGTALPAWLTFNPMTGAFSGTPANGDVGLLSLKVRATDPSGTFVESNFDLTIDPPSGDDLLDGVVLHGVINGGPGNDTITYGTATGAVSVNLATGIGSGAEATGDTYLSIENAIGSIHNDTLTGDGGANTLEGGAGADVLDGGAGTDTASYAGSSAGVNVDLIIGVGTLGDAAGDTLTGIENLIGSAHDDILAAVDSGSELTGGAGDDNLVSGAAADTLAGGAGDDWANYHRSTSAVTIDLGTGSASGGFAAGDTLTDIEWVYGSTHNDSLTGDAAANRLYGYVGDDTIIGGAGDDELNGGAGADTLDGGTGVDTADYSAATSRVAVDLIHGNTNTGVDGAVYGGSEAEGDVLTDIENVLGSSFDDSLTGDNFVNRLEGGDGADWLNGRDGNDTLIGGSGDDRLTGGAGADTLDGGAGVDQAFYAWANSRVAVDLIYGNTNTGADGAVYGGSEAEGDVLTDIENVLGSSFDDSLTGDNFVNRLEGGDGADWLNGRDGNDTLIGGSGDDRLTGGAGADTLDGGAGVDTAFYTGSSAGVNVDLITGVGTLGDAAGDTLTGIENLIGSAHDDILAAVDSGSELTGGAGDDNLVSGAAADTLAGGAGDDWANYHRSTSAVTIDLGTGSASGGFATGDTLTDIEWVYGSTHNDSLTGDAAANRLYGYAGDDTIIGGAGDDELNGGAGADTLTGGLGSDRFVFVDNDGVETITDFVAGAATDDVIDFIGSSLLNNFADVQAAASQVGLDTVIDMGNGDVVTLQGVNMANLHQDDFQFV